MRQVLSLIREPFCLSKVLEVFAVLEQLELFSWDVSFEHGTDGTIAIAVNIITWFGAVIEVDFVRQYLSEQFAICLSRWLHIYGA